MLCQKRPVWVKRDQYHSEEIKRDLQNRGVWPTPRKMVPVMSKAAYISQKRPTSFKRDLQTIKKAKRDRYHSKQMKRDVWKHGRDLFDLISRVWYQLCLSMVPGMSKETYRSQKRPTSFKRNQKRPTKQRRVTHVSQNGTCYVKSGLHKSKETHIIQKRPTND